MSSTLKDSFFGLLDFPKVDDTLVSMKVMVSFEENLLREGVLDVYIIGRLVVL
jgi:hypothetical protein